MKPRPFLRRFGIVAAILFAVLAVFAAANWQGIALGVAMASSEQRPALLDDAKWNRPETARTFNERFAPGNPEGELLAWLEANDFSVEPDARRASRRVRGLPCNERIEVEWDAANGRLARATANVAEAGCL